MFKNFRTIVAGTLGIATVFATSPAFADPSSTSTAPRADGVTPTDAGQNGKTSDRTPGNPAPDRTPNASTSGAVGTDAGKTESGTSDRTPSHNDQKSTGR
jgi:hypothetical protein